MRLSHVIHRATPSSPSSGSLTAARLARFPQLGEVLPEFPQLAYRQIVVGAYRLIYREDPQSNRVVVVGVIHGSRDVPPILESR